MISSVSSTASLYRSQMHLRAANRQDPALGTQPDGALLIHGASQGTPHGPARGETLPVNQTLAANTRYVGPARAAARAEALDTRPVKRVDMTAFYQDLMNGCQAGPKPVSVLAAEANYAKARGILG